MKNLKDIVLEKLKINKETGIHTDDISSKNYLISTESWPQSRVGIIIDILKRYVNANRKSLTKDQFRFANDLRFALKHYKETSNDHNILTKLINGEPPKFENLKCIYDAIRWTLDEDDTCPKPRRHKLELAIKDLDPYIDQVNTLEW